MHNIPRDEVFVIGHKNPDTDSICSAIAYADLRISQKINTFPKERVISIKKQNLY